MHNNAIIIVWGVKNCALFTKNMALFEKKNLCTFLCAFWPNKVRLRVQNIYVWKCNKNCLGGQKLCAFYQKYGSFWEKNIVHLFVRFLAKLGAPLSSELLTTLVVSQNFWSCKKNHKISDIFWPTSIILKFIHFGLVISLANCSKIKLVKEILIFDSYVPPNDS